MYFNSEVIHIILFSDLHKYCMHVKSGVVPSENDCLAFYLKLHFTNQIWFCIAPPFHWDNLSQTQKLYCKYTRHLDKYADC